MCLACLAVGLSRRTLFGAGAGLLSAATLIGTAQAQPTADTPDAALDRLLADPARAAAGAQARRDWLMPRFNIGLMQDQVGALYDDILAAKAARRGAPAPADVVRERA